MAAEREGFWEGPGLPDLADLPLIELVDSGNPVLARAIRLARARRAAAGIVYAGFHSGLPRVVSASDGDGDYDDEIPEGR